MGVSDADGQRDVAWPVDSAIDAAEAWGGGRDPVWLPTVGGGRMRAGRVFCVGRNFAAHAREMGGDPSREAPFFFCKPTDALCWRPRRWPLPPMSADVQHEVELAVVLSRGGAGFDLCAAEAAIGWGTVALDMTRRDLQAAAKAHGRPWTLAKGFDHSAPVGTLFAWPGGAVAANYTLAVSVSGAERQRAPLSDMIWTPAEVVMTLSQSVVLCAGDVVLCGTPAGVAAVTPGDALVATLHSANDIVASLAFAVDAVGASWVAAHGPGDVLAYWFGDGKDGERWLTEDTSFDATFLATFAADCAAAGRGELDFWASTPRGRLAVVLLLDQSARAKQRAKAGSYAADRRALAHAIAAVERGEDRMLSAIERAFLYLPFVRSASVDQQQRASALFALLQREGSQTHTGRIEAIFAHARRDHPNASITKSRR